MNHGLPTIRLQNPLFAELCNPTIRTAKILDDICTYYATGYQRDWKFKRGLWDGKERLSSGGMFPAGLAPKVIAAYISEGIVCVLDDWYQPVPRSSFEVNWDDSVELRPYQSEATEQALRERRGILHMATATGKTKVISDIIASLRVPTLIIVPTRELLHQTSAELGKQLGIEVAKFGDGESEFGNVTVALFQALSRYTQDLSEELASFACVISDEAHHSSASTWMDILLNIPAPYRFAFSGTIDTGKNEDILIEAMTGPVIFRYDSKQGIEDGYLTPPNILMRRPVTKYVPTSVKDNDFLTIYKLGIVENEVRNSDIAEQSVVLSQEFGKTLVVVKEIRHGEDLTARIQKLGGRAEFLNGVMGRQVRTARLRAFSSPDTSILVATSVLDEGVDVPDISCVVLAGAGKAQHKVAQRIGRGMRKGGEENLIVLDYYDDAHYILTNHSKERLKLYKSQGWEVTWI